MSGPKYLATMDEWMRDQEKRTTSVERRRRRASSDPIAIGVDLDNMLTDGAWDIDTPEQANATLHLPVPPLPATGADIATVRAASMGVLRVHSTPVRVLQTFEMALPVDGTPRTFTYKRMRDAAGVWGPWVLQVPAISVTGDPEQNRVVKALYARPVSPVEVRRLDLANPQSYVTKNGDTFWTGGGAPAAAPGWVAPTMGNGWVNYGIGYQTLVYRRSAWGLVVLRGLIKDGTIGTTIFTLPVGFRPAAKHTFLVATTTNAPGRLTIETDGRVVLTSATAHGAGSPVGYLSFADVMFPCAQVAPNSAWTNLTLLNSFYGYNTIDPTHPVPSYWVDPVGRYWSRGLIGRATNPGAALAFASLPAAAVVPRQLHLQGASNTGFSSQHYGTAATGTDSSFYWKPGGANGFTWFTLPAAPIVPGAVAPDSGWTALTLLNNWVNYDPVSYPAAAVWEAPDGLVHMRGLIKNGTTLTAIANLSVGIAPAGLLGLHPVNAAEAMGRADTSATAMSHNAGSNLWYSLDGITYLRES